MTDEDLTRVITDRLERLRADIVAEITNKRITASGRTQNSLQVEQYNGGVRLVANAGNRAPIPTLEIGRPGGKVPRNFTDIIVEWSRAKGLAWGNDIQRRRIAGAVAWGKIRRVGTDRHLRPENVYSTLVQEAVQDLRGYIMTSIDKQIKSNF